MQKSFILSGFGGQGALFAGMILTYAGMDSDQNVTWIPSYGPEMRGGTAHVTVIIGDEEIGSPLVQYPDAVMILNNPSMKKYEALVKEGGILVYNSSLVSLPPQRTDINYVPILATDIAAKLGNDKVANMVLLGALVAATEVLPLSAITQALYNHLPKKKHSLLPVNEQALQQGASVAASLNQG